MTLRAVYRPDRLAVSFELFPPKTAAGEAQLFHHVGELMKFAPDYVTCTYGAGGSTRDKTLDIVHRVKRDFGVAVATHLTCVGSTIDDLRSYLGEARQRGIDHVVALRGDPPRGETQFNAVAGGLRYASELVALLRREFPQFGVAVAGYPETHQEAPSAEIDLANLKRKVEAGADVVITQLFYDNADYARFVDRCRALGIVVPIIPGILPVTNLAQIQRITGLCKARLPEELVAALSAAVDESDVEASEAAQFEAGVAYATRQVTDLVARGAPGIHFYVLNKSQATARVLAGAGLADRTRAKPVAP
jgi:methylenetetrahydrofolate reductase (NADPH)